MFKKLFAATAGVLFAASLAWGAVYFGWNPSTGLETTHGTDVSGGPPPVVSGTCGTFGTQLGGASVGEVIAGAVTTCTITLTFPSAAPTGWMCQFQDLTTPADSVKQASYTTTSCTSTAATIVASDKIQYTVTGY